MNFSGNDGTAIATHPQWRRHGAPASSKHWVPGRSSFETMRAWLFDDAAFDVEKLIRALRASRTRDSRRPSSRSSRRSMRTADRATMTS